MQSSTRASWPAAAWITLVTLAVGCGRAPEPQQTTTGQPRIVSLSPAVSRTLLDFGLQQQIVGRSRWCASLDPAIPVLGDLYEINYEWLLRLDPTHVLLQPSASTGLDPTLERLAAEHDWVLGHWTINTIADIEQMVRDLPAVLFPGGGPCREAAAARAADLLNRIDVAVTPHGADLWSGPTLLIADTEPVVLVFGRETYLNDILTGLGAQNAIAARGWTEISLEDILRMDPQAIILVRDRGPSQVSPLDAAGPLADLDTTARREGRIAVLWHPDAKLPSSAVIGVAQQMRRVLAELSDSQP